MAGSEEGCGGEGDGEGGEENGSMHGGCRREGWCRKSIGEGIVRALVRWWRKSIEEGIVRALVRWWQGELCTVREETTKRMSRIEFLYGVN